MTHAIGGSTEPDDRSPVAGKPDAGLADVRHESLYAAVLADVLDTMGFRRQCLGASIRPLGASVRVAGRVFTARARETDTDPKEPYKLEMALVDTATSGDVLVVDANYDTTCGFWGELLTTACVAKGVNGVVMSACSRDLWAIGKMSFPVFGIGTSPADSRGRMDIVEIGEAIHIDGVQIHTGDYVLGDVDGVVIVPADAADEVFARAHEKVSGENKVRDELAAGVPVSEVFRKYGIL